MDVDGLVEKGRKIAVLVVGGAVIVTVVGFVIYSVVKIVFG